MCTYKLCGYTRRVYTHHKEARHSWLHSWVRGCQGMSVPDVHRHGWKLGPKQAGSMTAKVPSPLRELAVGCPALSQSGAVNLSVFCKVPYNIYIYIFFLLLIRLQISLAHMIFTLKMIRLLVISSLFQTHPFLMIVYYYRHLQTIDKE